jgi:hypothetical protein
MHHPRFYRKNEGMEPMVIKYQKKIFRLSESNSLLKGENILRIRRTDHTSFRFIATIAGIVLLLCIVCAGNVLALDCVSRPDRCCGGYVPEDYHVCSGKGQCFLYPSPHCICSGGWSGVNCEIEAPCGSSGCGHLCNGHGVCTNDGQGGERCYCKGEEAGGFCCEKSLLPTIAATSIVIDPATPSNIYVGVDGQGVYRTTTSGSAWTAATTQPANKNIRALVINPVTHSTLFAGTYGGGVNRSTNSGVDWGPCGNTGLANLNVLSLVTNTTGQLYAGTEAGVYTSGDCDTWTALNNGLP